MPDIQIDDEDARSHPAPLPAAIASHAQSPCRVNEISLTFPSEPGEFTGMSHDGTWMVLRNTSHRTCTVQKRPALIMQDAAGKPLPISLNIPRGMHPGPVLVPVQLKPGQTASSKMQWVMGEVYDHSTCANVAAARFEAPGGEVSAPLRGHMCGQSTDGIHFDQEWLQPDVPGRRR